MKLPAARHVLAIALASGILWAATAVQAGNIAHERTAAADFTLTAERRVNQVVQLWASSSCWTSGHVVHRLQSRDPVVHGVSEEVPAERPCDDRSRHG